MTAGVARIESRSRVLERYEVLEHLGEGGMGTVYRGHDPVLDRSVAIKTIGLAMPKEDVPDYEARFYQEARAAGGLSHPNIVVIYDIGKTERNAYMVMEFVDGRELRALLSERGALGYQEAAEVCAQVADALAYAHECGVVHRDIKPTNIMITRSGRVKITDFGIARMQSSELKTMTGMVLGSPRYMSPEQVTGRPMDHRTDVFSLGVVLYEMLTGQPPFQSDSVQGVMFQALNSTPQPPSRLNPAVPRLLDFIVAKCIAKDPAHRYATAAGLVADLRSFLGAGSTSVAMPVAALADTAAVPATPSGPRTAANPVPEPAPSDSEITTTVLSPAFDSSAATLRLQALSASAEAGVSGAQVLAPLPETATRPSPPPAAPRPPRADRAGLALLWLLSAGMATMAVYLFLR